MLWDFTSVYYEYNCLIKKNAALGLLRCRIGLGRNSRQIEEKRVGSVKEKPCSRYRRQMLDASQNLTGRRQPHSNTQFNKNGLIEDIRVSQ